MSGAMAESALKPEAMMEEDDTEEAAAGFDRVVFPGDTVTESIDAAIASSPSTAASAGAPQIKLGAGLLPAGEDVLAVRAGIITSKDPSRFFVLANHKRYYPAVGDTVVGIIADRNAEFYRVRLHGTTHAQLPVLAFDGATKRNKPNLAIGTLVFCRVVSVSKHLDPELSCAASSGSTSKDWVTGQSVYGELKEGNLCTISLGHARRLLHPTCALLTRLGGSIPFEVAVGVNGLVYVRATSTRHTTIICNAIERSEKLNEDECVAFVDKLLTALVR
jgi:exosome complex component RRP40